MKTFQEFLGEGSSEIQRYEDISAQHLKFSKSNVSPRQKELHAELAKLFSTLADTLSTKEKTTRRISQLQPQVDYEGWKDI